MVKQAKIFVVEDEPLSRDMLVRRLGTRNYDVEGIADAPTCLARLDDGLPDLILTDVSMPVMSGLQLLRAIRSKWSSDTLPVIMVTAMIDSDDVVAGLEAGANDYVVKPVNLPVLLARVAVWLKVREGMVQQMEMQRQRVRLEALAGACHAIHEPLSDVVAKIEALLAKTPATDVAVREGLTEILNWARDAGKVIAQVQETVGYRAVKVD